MNETHSAPGAAELEALRQRMAALKHADENSTRSGLMAELAGSDFDPAEACAAAGRIVSASREQKSRQGTLDAFLNQFGLSNQEGVTLMCLAEALLRVPDADTQDELIAEKILAGDWSSHRGHSDKLFVNAGVWALMLTGRVIDADDGARVDPGDWLRRLVARSGEPVIRTAVNQAMKIMGGQFVFGRSIGEALRKRADKPATEQLFSFDMLGEGARTAAAAERYWELYGDAIDAVGRACAGQPADPAQRSSVSIKLSALHPRYETAQRERVLAQLLPRVRSLALRAAGHGIQLTIDAEEADRLELSLELIEALARDLKLSGWNGLGLALQAYQKRAPVLVDWLAALARQSNRVIPVRLVKGAYWDTEIKHAQVMGYADYPVFTHKAATDLSYLVCARRLFEHAGLLYPQFATHNAHSIAAVQQMAGDRVFEFQRLHGMGELLYRAARESVIDPTVPLRTYAPVGAHQDLLPYLVRRLLENGANSSFVHRFLNETLPVAEVVSDPIAECRSLVDHRPRIPRPIDIYGPERQNSRGLDLTAADTNAALMDNLRQRRRHSVHGGCIVAGELCGGEAVGCFSPANRQLQIGTVRSARTQDLEQALTVAEAAQPGWNALGGAERAQVLRKMADALEDHPRRFLDLLSREAGRNLADGIAELREAIDFCRYYAQQAEQHFSRPTTLPGSTGESNQLELQGRGVFLCISPWNFPLAIFSGQIAAALAAGNTVIAKPADQTPLVASEAVRLFQAAGLPKSVLQLLVGSGPEVAEPLVRDTRIAGVAFTGSTATAQRINRTLAARDGAIVPLIAETGGQNAMVVDSTALLEQVSDDVIQSAFGSAGQRCSALRLLLVQDNIADELLEMLRGALNQRHLALPWELPCDIGTIIDEAARDKLVEHCARMQTEARSVAQLRVPDALSQGVFFGPRIFEIQSLQQLQGEVFGPILHVLRWNTANLAQRLSELRATGYGLTFGLHSRIAARTERLYRDTLAGNVYVNRNMVGAVVGVQPFGGSGLSGTGPKAGGPHYLHRFATERTLTINTAAIGGNAELLQSP